MFAFKAVGTPAKLAAKPTPVAKKPANTPSAKSATPKTGKNTPGGGSGVKQVICRVSRGNLSQINQITIPGIVI